MSNILSPLKVVELFHQRYLEYESAFENEAQDENQLQAKINKMVADGVDPESDKFRDAVVDLMVERPEKRSAVINSFVKFSNTVEVYLLIEQEPLPQNIMDDYENFPAKDNLKPQYSVENGKFHRNEKSEVSPNKELLKQYYDELLKEQ